MSEFNLGSGHYHWIDTAGREQQAQHWDDVPAVMDRLIAFVPDYPPEPHTDAEHAMVESFGERLQEALARCRHQ